MEATEEKEMLRLYEKEEMEEQKSERMKNSLLDLFCILKTGNLSTVFMYS